MPIFAAGSRSRRFRSSSARSRSNRGWIAAESGFEVQIDDLARPDGLAKHRTGAIYNADVQSYTPPPPLVPFQWYEYEIKVAGQNYRVGMRKAGDAVFTPVTNFTNTDPNRGPADGYIGLQSYANSPVAFRHIRVKV